jgi:hypothetical protein
MEQGRLHAWRQSAPALTRKRRAGPACGAAALCGLRWTKRFDVLATLKSVDELMADLHNAGHLSVP